MLARINLSMLMLLSLVDCIVGYPRKKLRSYRKPLLINWGRTEDQGVSTREEEKSESPQQQSTSSTEPSSSAPVSNGIWLMQEDPPSPFEKCLSVARSVSTEENLMFREQYLAFLFEMSNGQVDIDSFVDAPLDYVAIFYSVACSNGERNCNIEEPAVFADFFQSPFPYFELFCNLILNNLDTTVTSIFSFPIFYPEESFDSLETCLQQTVENVLLEEFCSPEVDSFPAQRSRSLFDPFSAFSPQQDTPNPPSPAIDCEYEVEGNILSVVVTECEDDTLGDGIQCAIARASSRVSAVQMLEPFEDVLLERMQSALLASFEDGSFASSIPIECSAAASNG